MESTLLEARRENEPRTGRSDRPCQYHLSKELTESDGFLPKEKHEQANERGVGHTKKGINQKSGNNLESEGALPKARKAQSPEKNQTQTRNKQNNGNRTQRTTGREGRAGEQGKRGRGHKRHEREKGKNPEPKDTTGETPKRGGEGEEKKGRRGSERARERGQEKARDKKQEREGKRKGAKTVKKAKTNGEAAKKEERGYQAEPLTKSPVRS